jgi:hypothetical protein
MDDGMIASLAGLHRRERGRREVEPGDERPTPGA